MLRPTLGPVPMQYMHVMVAEIGERRRGLLGELADSLDGVNISGDFGENGGRIARSSADLEHPLAAVEPERLRHECDDVGLRDGLALLNRQWRVFVGEFAKLLRQERLAGNAAHGVQHQFGADAPGDDGLFNHFMAKLIKVSLEMKIHYLPPPNTRLASNLLTT